jgi:HK97 family phage major capsid protein
MTNEEKAAHDELLNTIKAEITKAKKETAEEIETQITELEAQIAELEARLAESEKADDKEEEEEEAEKNQMKSELIELSKKVKAMNETPNIEKGTAAKEVEKSLPELKEIAKGAKKSVVIKALAQRSDIDSNGQAVDLPTLGQLATRKLTAYDAFPKITLGEGNHNGTIRYYDWDEATSVRAAANVAEGVAFPESTAKWKTYTLPLRKIGDTIPVTEELFEDAQMFAAELSLFLQTNVNVKIDDELINGDNTGQRLKGLFTSINAYTPVASGITSASIYDLIVKVSENITAVGGSKYQPNFAFMNIVDINKMKLRKDANNNYVIPPFSNGSQIVDGVSIIECNAVTANTMVIGDNRFARIYEMAGIELAEGTVGTQFAEDEMTLKARKRLLFLIRDADKGGFRKVTSISAALTTLAS